ncbi:MAG: hypothetical protein K9M57_04880, partial [Phycisphaerae bacterium]|nr:hypothetical protein [Phycisphaerae bacterium]
MFVQNYHGRYRIEFRRFRLHFSASALLLLIMVLCSCQTTYPEYQTYYPPKPPNATSDPVQKDPAENRSETVNPRAGTSAAHQVMDMRTYRAALAEGQQLGRPGTPGENMNPATPTVTAAVPKPPATHPGVRSSIKTGANRPENPQDRQNYYDIYDPANPYANKDGYVRVVAGAIYHPYKGNGVTAPKGQAITPIENPTVNPGGATASLPPQQRPPASRSTQAYPDLPTVTDVSVYNAVSSPEPLSDRRIPANITTLSGTNSISQTGSMPAMEPTASLPDVMVVPDRRPQPASFVEPIVSRQETGSRPKAPSLDGAIEYLEKLLEVNPQDVDARMALRLLYSAYGDSKNAFR